MADWLIEEGIGEHRAIRLAGETIAAARVAWPGRLSAGQVEDALLLSRAAGSPRGTAGFASGEQALVDRLPHDAREGAALRLEVTRAAMAERGRHKLARAVPSKSPPRPAPTLADDLRAQGFEARVVHAFPACDWDELWGEAWGGVIGFSGGSLDLALTPAMALIDIDGTLPPRELALEAIAPLSAALRRFDLAGNIGVDFPTLEAKRDRQAVDAALSEALADWPHEQTAMNGFGFVQIVSRLRNPSLLHRLSREPAGAAARMLLRRAERVTQPGALLLTAHPAVLAAISPQWQDELARRSGRPVRLSADPGLALDGGFAQSVPT